MTEDWNEGFHAATLNAANEINRLRSEVESLRAENVGLRRMAVKNFDCDAFRLDPPCYICGYNGEGYFNPDKHPCAAVYHEASAPNSEVQP